MLTISHITYEYESTNQFTFCNHRNRSSSNTSTPPVIIINYSDFKVISRVCKNVLKKTTHSNNVKRFIIIPRFWFRINIGRYQYDYTSNNNIPAVSHKFNGPLGLWCTRVLSWPFGLPTDVGWLFNLYCLC